MKRRPFLLPLLALALACSDSQNPVSPDAESTYPADLFFTGQTGFKPQRKAARAVQRTVRLSPVYGDVANMRWRDVAGHPYDPAVQDPASGYDYAQARVTVTFVKHAVSFQGHLSARGLKPNFAYQLKLNGKPNKDQWANDQLGTLGRWWTDSGYLVFDYVVTNWKGNVEHDLDLASSYHVLWRVDQRSPTSFSTESSVPTSHPVRARASSEWYDANYPRERRQIFAQSEHGEYPPGTVVLPAGPYNVSFFLTEESFHEEGLWATVMASDDIRFSIVDPLTKAVLGLTAYRPI